MLNSMFTGDFAPGIGYANPAGLNPFKRANGPSSTRNKKIRKDISEIYTISLFVAQPTLRPKGRLKKKRSLTQYKRFITPFLAEMCLLACFCCGEFASVFHCLSKLPLPEFRKKSRREYGHFL